MAASRAAMLIEFSSAFIAVRPNSFNSLRSAKDAIMRVCSLFNFRNIFAHCPGTQHGLAAEYFLSDAQDDASVNEPAIQAGIALYFDK
jgi:hypothetical protein